MAGWPLRLQQWRAEIEAAADMYTLAPELVAAVMDRESGGGVYLSPPGAWGTGDGGNGLGLMQIDRRYHGIDWDWWDAQTNINAGAKVLRDNLDALDQNLPAAICAYNASLSRVKMLLVSLDPTVDQFDQLTTHRDYVSDVLKRKAALEELEPPPLEAA